MVLFSRVCDGVARDKRGRRDLPMTDEERMDRFAQWRVFYLNRVGDKGKGVSLMSRLEGIPRNFGGA